MATDKSSGTGRPVTLAPEWSWTGKNQKPYLRETILALILIIGVVLTLSPAFIVNMILFGFAVFIVFMAALRIITVLITYNYNQIGSLLRRDSGKAWPKFTILVPLYKEAHMVADLKKHLSALDYPRNKLEIIFITESDDLPTSRAVRYQLSSPLKHFEVPPSWPRTKPKALNAAFRAISPDQRGDIITVYDAEDRPHPGQIKQAALKFMSDPDMAAVQAPLGYYNDRENLLTAMFSLEYAALFHVWNPALAKLGLPFTLGGTSNHIRRDVLEKCGGWDSNNVTEDADLSFRISAMNRPDQRLKIGTITLPTAEEAVNNRKGWTAQRSRWLKGFMQTWCVHMRFQKTAPDGSQLPTATRLKNLFALQITIGAKLLAAYLHVPSLIIMSSIYVANLCNVISLKLPFAFFIVMAGGYGAALLLAIIGAVRAKKPHLVKYAILMPLYWLLYFRPMLMATYEIVVKPTHWRKTTHTGSAESVPLSNEDSTLETTKAPFI